MREKSIYFLVWLVLALSSCDTIERSRQDGAAVEINGRYLHWSTLDSLTIGLSGEDSLRVAQQYVSQWAKDILVYDQAKARADKEIEDLVEDYRRALYVHAYEEYLVEQYMPKTIIDSVVVQMYTQSDLFLLEESIVKGVLLVYPKDAPQANRLKQCMNRIEAGSISTDDMDFIEKYAYQHASGYELFIDRWLTTTSLLKQLPVESAELEQALKKNNQIELTDSTQVYLLQVTEKFLKGEKMPLDYAQPTIRKILLSKRQVDFLQKERERLYEQAIQKKQIIFYNK